MTRLQRVIPKGKLHHLQQRGHNGMEVFFDDKDRLNYLRCFFTASEKFDLNIHTFQLLNSEAHWLVSPGDENSISFTIQSVGRSYVRYFNQRWSRSGTLWDGRYRTYWLDKASIISLSTQKFIDQLSKKTGLINEEIEWKWSSCAYFCGLFGIGTYAFNKTEFGSKLSPIEAYWSLGNTPFERQKKYRDFLKMTQPDCESEEIRKCLSRGKPRITDNTFNKLSAEYKKIWTYKPRGRPRIK